jgi:glutamate-ammonia-ligase adenylyltransferase
MSLDMATQNSKRFARGGGVKPIDAAKAESYVQDLKDNASASKAVGLLSMLQEDENLCLSLSAIMELSPFLRDLMMADAARLERVLKCEAKSHIKFLSNDLITKLESSEQEADAMRELRLFRQEAAITISLADLLGKIAVMEATALLTQKAEAALQGAIGWLLKQEARRGRFLADPETNILDIQAQSGLIVLGMGKLGAGELNFSSDIDLIVIFDPEKAPLKDAYEAQGFFVKITQRLVKLMQERTADGYVFRTDLRLRPDPGATAVAMSIDAALTYYESMGQTWERAAMIKARPVAGDIDAGKAFLDDITPFVWRRYLDYAAIADIEAIKQRIHDHKGHGEIGMKGHNVKLGRGGIREIEFFAQSKQLLTGGRDIALRGLKTLSMLKALSEKQWIKPDAQKILQEAYLFLRHVEHRLQMIRDEQTHILPDNEEALLCVARLSGFETLKAFEEKLMQHMQAVHQLYLDDETTQPTTKEEVLDFYSEVTSEKTLQKLEQYGFDDPKQVDAIARGWLAGRYAATRAKQVQERLKRMLPRVMKSFGASDNGMQALIAFDRFLAGLPAGVQLFSMLEANHQLISLMARVMGTAPRLAETVARRPHVMDAVLDPTFFGTIPEADIIADHIRAFVGEAEYYEDVLDRARIGGREQQFLLGVRILTGTISATQAGRAFTSLADTLVEILFEKCFAEFAKKHGKVPGGQAAIVAMGKLGGREMTAASDLDLMLIYNFDEDAAGSDGEKPLSPQVYFTRLTQRIVSALSAQTAEGSLYEVDFRLRPSGNSGPLATSLQAFETYQHEQAWTWEHMALTRARPIAGDPDLCVQLEAIIADVLTKKRDMDKLKEDIVSMRARLQKEKGTSDPFDIKQVPGGLVDVEFIAQGLQLMHAHDHESILSQTTKEVLMAAKELSLLNESEAETLVNANRLYHNVTQIQRLCVDGPFRIETAAPGLSMILSDAAAMPDQQTLEAHLKNTESDVRTIFEQHFGMVVP